MGLWVLGMQGWALYRRSRRLGSIPLKKTSKQYSTDEDDELDWDDPIWQTCWDYTFMVESPTGPLGYFHILLKGIVTGIFVSASMAYLSPMILSTRYSFFT